MTRGVCPGGPGHFPGSEQTLGRMQSDYYYPALANRSTPQVWADAETPELLETARAKTREILDARTIGLWLGKEHRYLDPLPGN